MSMFESLKAIEFDAEVPVSNSRASFENWTKKAGEAFFRNVELVTTKGGASKIVVDFDNGEFLKRFYLDIPESTKTASANGFIILNIKNALEEIGGEKTNDLVKLLENASKKLDSKVKYMLSESEYNGKQYQKIRVLQLLEAGSRVLAEKAEDVPF